MYEPLFKYGKTEKISKRREKLIEQVPFDRYILTDEIEGKKRDLIKNDLEGLYKIGFVRKGFNYKSASPKASYRRINL